MNGSTYLPRSVVGWLDAPIGLAAVLAVFFAVRTLPQTTLSDEALTLLLCLSLGVIMGAIEIMRAPWHAQPRPNIPFAQVVNGAALKLAALFFSFAVIGFLWWVLPEYHRDWYAKFFSALRIALPFLPVIAIPYFIFAEWRFPQERSGISEVVLFLLGKWQEVRWEQLSQYALGWLVKGFFLPIMFGQVANGIGVLRAANWDFASQPFASSYFLLFDAFILFELIFVSAGYALAMRVFDTHVRRVESTLFGWTVTVISYAPFLSLFYIRYFNYDQGVGWFRWLAPHPAIIIIYGSVILLLLAIHMWSDACFGIRFSNLTNRGIITNGPYRFSKHPAYFIKSIRWALVSLPFIASTPVEGLRLSALFVFVCVLYTMRSYAEERLLSRDPTYVAYARWMQEHGWLRFLKRFKLFDYEWRLARWQRQWPGVYGQAPASDSAPVQPAFIHNS